MKANQQGFSAIEALLIVVMVGLIAGVGWYVYQAKNKTLNSLNNASSAASSPQKSSSKNSTATNTTYAKTDPYASWQTVKSPDSTWTVKIPQDWLTQACDGGYFGIASSKAKLGACASSNVSEVSLTVANNQEELKNPPTKTSDDQTFKDEIVTINGVDGHKYTELKTTESPVSRSSITYVLPSNGKVFTVTYVLYQGDSADQTIFDQIVQTWKF